MHFKLLFLYMHSYELNGLLLNVQQINSFSRPGCCFIAIGTKRLPHMVHCQYVIEFCISDYAVS